MNGRSIGRDEIRGHGCPAADGRAPVRKGPGARGPGPHGRFQAAVVPSIGRSSSAYETETRRISPSPVMSYWPSRHSGGEYACTDTASSVAPVSRWMWSGPKQNDAPAPTAVARCSPPMRGVGLGQDALDDMRPPRRRCRGRASRCRSAGSSTAARRRRTRRGAGRRSAARCRRTRPVRARGPGGRRARRPAPAARACRGCARAGGERSSPSGTSRAVSAREVRYVMGGLLSSGPAGGPGWRCAGRGRRRPRRGRG